MKTLLTVEEAAQFAVTIILFNQLPFSWWVYPALFFLPDLSMLGYSVNAKVGALTYNLAHHKALAIVIGVVGWYLANDYWQLAGIVLFGHSSLDRMFGYGLKYDKGFESTHLGEIGNQKNPGKALGAR